LKSFNRWLPEELLDQLTPHFLNGRPNTYSYTKGLAENLIEQECKTFPTAVVRPSIVINSEIEPIPGWIDNLNGPQGIIVLASMGILRCLNWNYYAMTDNVPVDKVVNALIAVGYATGKEKRFAYFFIQLTFKRSLQNISLSSGLT
jgi:fatty acyl-CoA reductase